MSLWQSGHSDRCGEKRSRGESSEWPVGRAGCEVEEEDLTETGEPRPEGGRRGAHLDTRASCVPGRVSSTCKGPEVKLAWNVR